MKTTSHALLECPVSLEVWRLSQPWPTLADMIPLPFADILRLLGRKLTREDLSLFCWLAWRLWGERNEVLHGSEPRHPFSLLEVGLSSLGEWTLLHQEDLVQQGLEGVDHWQPPSHGFFKLNVDTAVHGGSKNGEVVGAMSSALTGGFSPFATECLALREGL